MELQEYKGAILPQQALFAEHYVANGYNGQRAAIAAKYGVKGAKVQANRLLTNVNVKAYVDALARINSDSIKVDIDMQLKRLSWLQQADIRHYIYFDGKSIKFKPFDQLTDEQAFAIKGIKNTRHGIELILHDKAWSVDMINKHLGFYEKDNGQKGEALAAAVAVLLPDNGRGKVVPMDVPPVDTP